MKKIWLQCAALVMALGMTMASVAAQQVEWKTWETDAGGNGHQYTILMEEGTWLEQAAAAEALGGYLATLQTLEEHDFVWELIRAAEAESAGSSDYYAFGLRQSADGAEPDGGWYWVSGETFNDSSYQPWGYREPNNYRDIEDFGGIHRSRKGWYAQYWWNDIRNNADYRAVVEREGPPPPQDTTAPATSLNEPEPSTLPWSDDPVAVQVSGSVTDADSGVADATLSIADEYGELSGEQALALADDGSFSVTLQLAATARRGDADGRTYEISLSAVDNAGNQAEAGPVSVTVPPDTTPPMVRLDSLDPAQLSWKEPDVLKAVTVYGSATDSQSGIESATVYVTDEYGEFDGEHDVTLNLDDIGYFQLTLQLSSRIDGGDRDGRVYEIELIATDLMGNVSAPASTTIAAQRPSQGDNPHRPPHAGGPDTPPGHDRRPDNPNRRGR